LNELTAPQDLLAIDLVGQRGKGKTKWRKSENESEDGKRNEKRVNKLATRA